MESRGSGCRFVVQRLALDERQRGKRRRVEQQSGFGQVRERDRFQRANFGRDHDHSACTSAGTVGPPTAATSFASTDEIVQRARRARHAFDELLDAELLVHERAALLEYGERRNHDLRGRRSSRSSCVPR